MKTLISILTMFVAVDSHAQLFISPGGNLGIAKDAIITLENMDVENQGFIVHSGDMEVGGNIINSNSWICDSAYISRIALTLNWSNNLTFSSGIGRVEFNIS